MLLRAVCFFAPLSQERLSLQEVQMLMQMCREDEQGNVLVYEEFPMLLQQLRIETRHLISWLIWGLVFLKTTTLPIGWSLSTIRPARCLGPWRPRT